MGEITSMPLAVVAVVVGLTLLMLLWKGPGF